MISLSLAEFAVVVEGELFTPENLKQAQISEVITDSRTFFKNRNSVFFALVGPTNNGHNYIASLLTKGMRVFVVSDKQKITTKACYVLVDDTTKALQKLAAYNRRQFTYPTIGITGSNGKTIIKEWLYEILSSAHTVVRSPKSYNSQIGVPLSVLLMNTSFDFAIIEAGISQCNEMKNLATIIQPNIGILTNIGDAHQENFATVNQKLQEKLLLFKQSEKLIFRCDNTALTETIFDFCKKNAITPFNWSLKNKDALVQFSINTKAQKTEICATKGSETFTLNIPFTDDSAIENACHCVATLLALDYDPEVFSSKFEELQAVEMRMEIKQGINNCLLIDDYYNSDLNSLSIALSVLKQQAAKEHLFKQVILSDIRQSGLAKPELYHEVNKLLLQWGINKLVGIGPDILANKQAFSIQTEFYSNTKAFEIEFKRHRFKSSAILIKGARHFKFEKISSLLQQKAHQTVLEININALIHNLSAFRALLKPSTKIMVMVKAFSYGSGDIEIAQVLQHQNVDYLAVAVADEGVQLRNAGISIPIVVMNPERDSFQNIIDFDLEPNIYNLELLQNFTKTLISNARQNFPIHLKIDTGMNRLGLKGTKEILEVVDHIQQTKELKVQSVFSHLVASDESDFDAFTETQIEQFTSCYELISQLLPYKIDKHILNSAGIERFTNSQFDMVRLGIGLYGISHTELALENIGTFKSSISQIKKVKSSETVGYSRKGTVLKETIVAVVPVGYADGLNRKLGNRNASAFVNGKRVPIIGNICMDMLMLDISEANACEGDSVEFFGPNISIRELAEKLDTIPYEILTSISQRVKRVYLQE